MSQKGFATAFVLIGILVISGLIIGLTLYFRNSTTSKNGALQNKAFTEENKSKDLIIESDGFRMLFHDPKADYFSTDVNGSNKKNIKLEYNPSSDMYVSPNGNLVAEVSLWGDSNRIQIFNFKDSTLKTVVSTSSVKREEIDGLVWSSDGSKIIYRVRDDASDGRFEESRIYLLDLNSSDPKLIFTSQDQFITLLRLDDKNMLHLFNYKDSKELLEIIDATKGGKISSIEEPIGYPDITTVNFSKDFSKIYYVKGENIVEIDSATKAEKVLYTLKYPDMFNHTLENLFLLPNGEEIIFLEANKDKQHEIKLLNIQTGSIKSLFSSKKEIKFVEGSSRYNNTNTISPDGKYLYFSSIETKCGDKKCPKDLESLKNLTNYSYSDFVYDIPNREYKEISKLSKSYSNFKELEDDKSFGKSNSFIGWIKH